LPAWRPPRLRLVVISRHRADLHLRRLKLPLPALDERVPVLAGSEQGAVRHRHAVPQRHLHVHVDEHPRLERKLRVGEREPRPDGARFLVDRRIDELHDAFPRHAARPGKAHRRGLSGLHVRSVGLEEVREDPDAAQVADAVEDVAGHRPRPCHHVLLQHDAAGRTVDGDARLGLPTLAQIRDLLVREPPQPQALLCSADELFPPRDALAVDRDQVVLLAGQQIRAVEHEQRLAGLDRLAGLADEQLLDVRVVLEHHVRDLRLVHLHPAVRAQRERQLPTLHFGEDDADELLALRADLQHLRATFAGASTGPARLDRVPLARWRDLEAQLGRRVPRRLDPERHIPVAQHGEAVADVVVSASERLGLAVALHLRHPAHRRHVVDEPDARALHRLALGVFDGDAEDVVSRPRRIRVEGDLHEKVAGVECVGRARLRFAAGREQHQQHSRAAGAPLETVARPNTAAASDALHDRPPRLVPTRDRFRRRAAALRAAARSRRGASPGPSRACAARARCRAPW